MFEDHTRVRFDEQLGHRAAIDSRLVKLAIVVERNAFDVFGGEYGRTTELFDDVRNDDARIVMKVIAHPAHVLGFVFVINLHLDHIRKLVQVTLKIQMAVKELNQADHVPQRPQVFANQMLHARV